MQATSSERLAIFGTPLLLFALCVLAAVQASAIPIHVTSGQIRRENLGPVPFEFTETFVHLEGAGFLLESDPRFDQLSLFVDGPPGSTVDLSAGMQILSVATPIAGSLIYGGQSYFGTNVAFNITTPTFVIGPTVRVPFSLSGSFDAHTLEGDIVDFELVGGGRATASFAFVDSPGSPQVWTLDDVTYTLESVPEPTALILLGSGLVGVAARSRSARRNRS